MLEELDIIKAPNIGGLYIYRYLLMNKGPRCLKLDEALAAKAQRCRRADAAVTACHSETP